MKLNLSSILSALSTNLKDPESGRGRKLLRAALIILVIFFLIIGGMTISGLLSRDAGALALMPAPDESAPYAMLTIANGELPAEIFKLLLDSPTVFPSGNSPVITLLPVFKTAESSALVISERENNFVMYGSLKLNGEELSSLSSVKLPEKWKRLLTLPELSRADKDGVIRLTAANLDSPLYIELHDGSAYVADSLSDMERIQGVRSGTVDGVKTGWKLNRSWGGHLLISDGGIVSALLAGVSDPIPQDRIGVEIAWKSGGPDGKPHSKGELAWRFSGFGGKMARSFLGKAKPMNWDAYDIFIPSPTLLSLGLNLPEFSSSEALSNSPLKSIAERIVRLGLSESEAGELLTGPAVTSIGGMTQLLWFELPGAALDIFDRGKTAYKLIDAFWAKLFMGAEPKPIPGYAHGGTTDLPFPIMAACNDKNAVIALAAPDVERDEELKKLLKKNKSSIGWFYADLPKLGNAIANMPSMSALLSENEDTSPTDAESTELLRESLDRLSKLFVVWESGDSGHGVWYR